MLIKPLVSCVEGSELNAFDLISWVKKMHQNVGVNAFKMQVEHMGAGTRSAAFVIIDIPVGFFFFFFLGGSDF